MDVVTAFKSAPPISDVDKLVADNIRLAFYFAKRWYGQFEVDEVNSLAFLGLTKAAKTFDPDKGIKFATYAARVINNEIRMAWRKDQNVKANRNGKMLGSFQDIITNDFEGNELSLEDVIPSDVELEDSVVNEVYKRELEREVFEALERLNEKQRGALYLYYIEGLNQRETSERMGISQSYVSRLLKQGRSRLRRMFGVAGN